MFSIWRAYRDWRVDRRWRKFWRRIPEVAADAAKILGRGNDALVALRDKRK